MKTLIFKLTMLVIVLSGFSFSSLQAQDHKKKEIIKEKLKANHAAFITNELNLTEEESQKFWPVYNQYKQEMETVKEEGTSIQAQNMTEKEAEEFLNKMLEKRAKEIDIQKKYIQKLKTAIPARKIVLLFQAEKEFREQVVRNMKNRRENRREREN